MKYRRLPIEIESPEQFGYDKIKYNLAESSYRDQLLSGLTDGIDKILMSYGDHLGLPTLRQKIAKLYHAESHQVITTVGAAHALFMVHQVLLEKGDHMIVASPNYSNNLEMPKVMEASLTYLDLTFDNDYSFSLEDLKALITTNTKLISLTTPHNPSGRCIPPQLLQEIIELCEEKNIYLLLDLTYLDLDFNGIYANTHFLTSDKVIAVSSLSKSSGLPGIRMGWVVCKDDSLMEAILAAKEQSILTHSLLDEYVADQFMQRHAENMQNHLDNIRGNFQIVKDWMTSQDIFEWCEPEAGCIGFVRFKEKTAFQLDVFYDALINEYACYVGPGRWFDLSDHYFRLGFGYPTPDELREGLRRLIKSAERATI